MINKNFIYFIYKMKFKNNNTNTNNTNANTNTNTNTIANDKIIDNNLYVQTGRKIKVSPGTIANNTQLDGIYDDVDNDGCTIL